MTKHTKLHGFIYGLFLSVVFTPAVAVVSSHTMDEFTSYPINQADTVTPMVMIAASNDHQLFFKAYSDYDDLDGDGKTETGYENSFDYYGYFDSFKCYLYDTSDLRYEPATDTDANHLCAAGNSYWSGNFLNWASMTRIDAVRKILFGGHRRTDTSSLTVLERAFLPHDAHAFAKYYAGDNLTQLTPFSNATGSAGTSTTSLTLGCEYLAYEAASTNCSAAPGTETFTVSGLTASVGDGIRMESDASSGSATAAEIVGVVSAVSGSDIDVDILYQLGGRLADGTFVSAVYQGWKMANLNTAGITLCNTTVASDSTDVSEDVTDPPLIRVASGNHQLWAGNERWQCTWSEEHDRSNGNNPLLSAIFASSSSPSKATYGLGEDDYVARVVACDSAHLTDTERCKLYPDGNYKPIGLLQQYGDDEVLHFGMISGSYLKNKAGGTLTKNIGNLADEINITTDGTFKLVSSFAQDSGVATNSSEGLINNWSTYRIVKYRYDDGTYGTNGLNSNNCEWGNNSFSNGQCINWGSPFGEIYLNALRYYNGASVSGTFRSNQSPGIPGLPTPQTWNCPLDGTNYCARLNIVNFNSSTFSYDYDDLDGNSDGIDAIRNDDSVTSRSLTDIIGANEGIHGNQYFVGNADNTNNSGICTAKTVSSLGDVIGLCPEAPRLEGSFRTAGLAYYAHVNDIRATGNDALTGSQKVDTYSVALSAAVPKIEITVGSDTVTLLPACQNSDVGGNCAIVDFKEIYRDTINGVEMGKFYVNWEDSEQGGDYDQDMWGEIRYRIDTSTTPDTITITTDVHAESTSFDMGFGYIISGTTQDGFHAHSGIHGYDYTDATGVTACSNCAEGDAETSVTYTVGTSTASLLKDPLWYASKYGGFNDQNGNDLPDLQAEWDEEDADGNKNPDGVPDTYFYATNPAQLEASLNRVFLKILQRASSGTAAAVVANSASGAGAVYQAYYIPVRSDANGNEAKWVGNLQALWIDKFGLLREDDGDKVLEGFDVDKKIEIFFDDTDKRTKVRRFTSSTVNTFTDSGNTVVELEALKPLWNARKLLSSVATVTSQRTYSNSAAGGRYMFTWIDSNLDDDIDSGEVIDFLPSNITSSNFSFFDYGDNTQTDAEREADTEALVAWVRGDDQTGMRPRQVDYDGDGTVETIRLGDIVNSTPMVVGAPPFNYDIRFNDDTYEEFWKKYKNRRSVIYTGANDGVLHAFNGAFFDAGSERFLTSIDLDPDPNNTVIATAHPLGSELWAYVPYNLLPHLKWLSRPDYTHIYYVDAPTYAFDAKIFADADTDGGGAAVVSGVAGQSGVQHPNGWGTVLVVGMRFGGGSMTIDTGNDGFGNGNSAAAQNDREFKSAFIMMDVTDPESPPKLLGEIQLPDKSFTSGFPTALMFKDKSDTTNATGLNKWYFVAGTGPTNLQTGASTVEAKLYFYDLHDLTLAPVVKATGVANSFIGDPSVIDWDLDYAEDTIYFGISGDATGDSGRLMRIETGPAPSGAVRTENTGNSDPNAWVGPSTVIQTDQPVTVLPLPATDPVGNEWVYFGTGRMLSSVDKTSTTQQALYGIKDSGTGTTLINNILNVTGATILADGTQLVQGIGGVTDFTELEAAVDTAGGWVRDLNIFTGTPTPPSERNVTSSVLLGEILFSTTYTPNTDLCASEGTSQLFGLYYLTGTASPRPVFGTTNESGDLVSLPSIDLGLGQAAAPTIQESSGSDQVRIIVQNSTGAMGGGTGKLPKKKSGEINWREIVE